MFKREIIDQALISDPTTTATMAEASSSSDSATTTHTNKVIPKVVYQANANCSCGKVQARIQTLPYPDQAPPPIRLVCYCRDCRGYFETLRNHHECNNNNNNNNKTIIIQDDDEEEEEVQEIEESNDGVNEKSVDASATDEWGGVDWTCLYPRDVQIVQGRDMLQVVKIRSDSSIRQVYSTCCHSPMFRIGGFSLLVNTNIIISSQEETELPPIQYRIIGRQAWKKERKISTMKESPSLDHQPKNKNKKQQQPKRSWSLPLKWYFDMPKRIRKDLMEPMPLEFNDESQDQDVQVLEGFQEGSK